MSAVPRRETGEFENTSVKWAAIKKFNESYSLGYYDMKESYFGTKYANRYASFTYERAKHPLSNLLDYVRRWRRNVSYHDAPLSEKVEVAEGVVGCPVPFSLVSVIRDVVDKDDVKVVALGVPETQSIVVCNDGAINVGINVSDYSFDCRDRSECSDRTRRRLNFMKRRGYRYYSSFRIKKNVSRVRTRLEINIELWRGGVEQHPGPNVVSSDGLTPAVRFYGGLCRYFVYAKNEVAGYSLIYSNMDYDIVGLYHTDYFDYFRTMTLLCSYTTGEYCVSVRSTVTQNVIVFWLVSKSLFPGIFRPYRRIRYGKQKNRKSKSKRKLLYGNRKYVHIDKTVNVVDGIVSDNSNVGVGRSDLVSTMSRKKDATKKIAHGKNCVFLLIAVMGDNNETGRFFIAKNRVKKRFRWSFCDSHVEHECSCGSVICSCYFSNVCSCDLSWVIISQKFKEFPFNLTRGSVCRISGDRNLTDPEMYVMMLIQLDARFERKGDVFEIRRTPIPSFRLDGMLDSVTFIWNEYTRLGQPVAPGGGNIQKMECDYDDGREGDIVYWTYMQTTGVDKCF